MTLEEMKARRIKLGLTYEQVARLSGIPIATVQKIFGGATKSPRYKTLMALEKILSVPDAVEGKAPAEQDHIPDTGAGILQEIPASLKSALKRSSTAAAGTPSFIVRETPAAYNALPADPIGTKRQGEYTIHDLELLPEDQRVELIDGVLYDMAEPTTIHQLIVVQLLQAFSTCISEHNMDCIPFVAPTGVQLDEDIYTMVEPDILVVCDRSRILKSHIFGAPDLCVEVLSPSTRSKDMNLKSEKYRKAGVKEYWLVDPDKRKIIVYLFGESPDINIYGFDSTLPISISKGACEVDFSKIYDYVKFLM